ncbi:hypothetical protein QCA50_000174 [Cerrena zonata]|uniref:DUF6593 domain-containing protein n=1 Tax=Cerrena zonata TaxID=2478898 RepID=A0AAW0GXF6_9APHY
MAYPSYNSGSYPPQGPPSYNGAPGYQTGYPAPSGPYPPQGPPAPGAPPPQGYQQGYQAGYGQPPQPSYGGYPPAQPPQPGYPHTPTPPAAPGGYAPGGYGAGYNQGYQPSRSPQPGHAAPYPGQQPGGYGSPYPAQAPPHGYGAPPPQPGYGAPAVPGYGAPGPQAAYGAPAAQAPPPGGDRPVQFQFKQDNGFDSSGKVIDAQGKAIFIMKDESDGHSWTKYLKTRPLQVNRSDGTKFANIDWKGGPEETKVTLHAIWAKGEKMKMKIEGDILDQDWKFRLPNGHSYEWEGPGNEATFSLLDQQQVSGSGFDTQAKTVARYMMHTEDRDATLELLPEALAVPDLLDACVLTSFYLEYYMQANAEEDGPSTSAALSSALQQAAANGRN